MSCSDNCCGCFDCDCPDETGDPPTAPASCLPGLPNDAPLHGLATASLVPAATASVKWLRPLIHVRVQAIVTANDDGSKSATATPDGIARAIADTNGFFAPAGIQFDYDPSTDYETRHASILNYDCFGSRAPANGPMPKCDKRPNAAAREAMAARYPRKLVLLFRSFNNRLVYDPFSGLWQPSSASGGYSSKDMGYVVVGPGNGAYTFLAHEIGHYLHLQHTFRRAATVADAAAMIRRFVEQNRVPLEQGILAFDGDYDTVTDTPPDPDGDIYKTVGLDKCGPTNDIQVPVTFRNGQQMTYTLSPDRHNLMSYYKNCRFFHDFSPQQMTRMREALLQGNRRRIVSRIERDPGVSSSFPDV